MWGLSIEEKAKRYDDAINRMKHYVVDEYGCSRIKVTDVFPELKESEDERIRRVFRGWIYTLPDSFFDGISKEKMLAWLEKNGEQKQEWSEEDERISKTIIIGIENEMFSDEMREEYQRIPNINKDYHQIKIDWLKGLKDRIQSKQSNKS